MKFDTTKDNRSIRTSQKWNSLDALRKMYIYEYENFKINLNKKNLSKKEIEIIKEKIRRKIIKERITRNIFVSLITFVIFILIIFLLNKILHIWQKSMTTVPTIFDRFDDLKHNRSLKTSQNKKSWTDLREMYIHESKNIKLDLNKKNLTKKEIELIKEKIRKKIIKERITKNIFVSLITLVIFALLIYLINTKLNIW